MKPITGKYRLVLVALLLLPPQAIAGDGGKDPTGQSLASASNPADTAAQAFSKTTYAFIPLDEPASGGGTHEYRVSCITDDGEVDFTHYSSTDLGNPYSWQTERLLWWRGDIDAATFFPISGREYNPMNRAGQYTYLEFLPDSSGGENAGVKGVYVRRDGTESEIDFPKYDAEITTQVNEAQNFLLARDGGWSSVSISPLTSAIVRGFSFFPLEDGTSFSSIDESREYSRTRVHIPDSWPFTDKIWGSETVCEKWGHWGVHGATPALFDGAQTIKELWSTRSAEMYSAGGMGQDAFCIVDETTAGPGGIWITTRKLRDRTGAVAADLGEQGFKIQGLPATSRNGHLAKRQTNGCIRYQYPSAEKEILPAAFGSGTGGEGVQVNDVGDLLIQNAGATDNATSDMLVRKFTDPVTQEIVWAARQFSDDTLPEGWSGLQIDALANAQPLAKQRELEALTPSAYPPKAEDTPVPLLGGIAMKDGKQYPVLLLPFDVDVDSDNSTAENYPDQSQSDRGSAEEDAEHSDDEELHPGVRVYANLIDADTDGVPGYADGIDMFGNGQSNSCWKFEPLIIETASLGKFPNAKFKFKYSASDPSQMIREGSGTDAKFSLPVSKVLRIWKKDGDKVRNPQAADQEGDFIVDDQEYSAEQLGLQEGETIICLYIEVVKAAVDQSYPIEVEFYPLGTSYPVSVGKERLKVRPYYISRENPGTDNSGI